MKKAHFFHRYNMGALVIAMVLSSTSVYAVDVTGAGASFPAPVYAQWADSYQKATQSKVNYQSIGSSGGVKQIKAKTVDFGASDAPLSEQELAQNQLFQFPTVIGGVVIAVNIPGIQSGELVLDGKTLGDIYLGKITKWNDTAITRLNPSLVLPAQDIQTVFRSDGSGTSYVFTSYLAKVNEAWQGLVTKSFPEPQEGYTSGAKGNEGVAATIQRQVGSIGYVEYTYAKQNNLTFVKLLSADGEVVAPSEQAFSRAAVSADWHHSFAQDLTNRSGVGAWPITSTTFILVPKIADNPIQTKGVLTFFDWSFQYGAPLASQLDYAPLPDSVVDTIRNAWQTEILDKDGKAVY